MNILYLDDDRFCRLWAKRVFSGFECDLYLADSPWAAINLLNSYRIDRIVTDYMFSSTTGLEFARTLKTNSTKFANTPIFLVTGSMSEHIITESALIGVINCAEKPMSELFVQEIVSLNASTSTDPAENGNSNSGRANDFHFSNVEI